jgi:hypothetical protein
MNRVADRCNVRRIVPILLAAVLILGCRLVPRPGGSPATSTTGVEVLSLTEALAVPPDDQRPTVLAEMGPPDAFSLRFDELEGQVVRWETWSYFDFGTRFDFIDGELLWTVELEPVPDGTIYAHFYDPADFRAGMGVAEVVSMLEGQDSEGRAPQEINLGAVDLEGGVALAGDQILLGFQDDRLVFVETVILTPDAAGEPLASHPLPEPDASQAADDPPAAGRPLLQDDFSGPLRLSPIFGTDQMVLESVNGQAHITSYAVDAAMVAVYPDLILQDFIAEVDIATHGLSSDSDAGFLFRGDPDLDDRLPEQSHYTIGLGGPPYYELRLMGWSTTPMMSVLDYADFPEALITEDGVYTLRIEVQGSSFRVYVDGTFVTEFVDATITQPGILGLGMFCYEPPETAIFDNLVIYPHP